MYRSSLIIVLAILFMASCELNNDVVEQQKIASYSLSYKEDTSIGKALAPEIRKYPGQSGFRVMMTGSESFEMRLALIQAAEKTLDLQYYSIHDDTTANLLLEAVMRAAKRGVRIRFLIDNISFGEVERTFSVLNEYKNVEIRVFNPLVPHNRGIIPAAIDAVSDIGSMNRRMHNKVLMSDNQMAIIGGRNLGDEYFEENSDVTFKDIDILIAGPITTNISQSFDRYWNSQEAIPVANMVTPETDIKKIEKIRNGLREHWEEVLKTPKGKKLLESNLASRLKDADVKLDWAPAELAVDEPSKVNQDAEDTTSKPMVRLDRLLEHAKKEFIAVSPYFIPRDDGVEWLAGIVKRGVKVKVLTNSLASTDVVIVHSGYKDYRKKIIESGIELYEMKAISGKRPEQRLIGRSAPAQAALHAKVYVIDRQDVMIGSFNLDPRSIELNTEIALVIHSKAIAAQVVKMFEEVTAPDTSYRVTLDENRNGNIIWKGRENGKEVQYHSEPKSGFWRSIQEKLMSVLPVEDYL